MTELPVSRLSRVLHGSYLLGLGMQAVIGGSQLLGAVTLLVAERTGWLRHLARVTAHDRAHPSGPVMGTLMHMLHQFTQHPHAFWAIYLLGHGVLNLGVVAALLAKKSWAHPASMLVLAGFVGYQLDRYHTTHAPVLILLSVFDLVVIGLVWREWSQVRQKSR